MEDLETHLRALEANLDMVEQLAGMYAADDGYAVHTSAASSTSVAEELDGFENWAPPPPPPPPPPIPFPPPPPPIPMAPAPPPKPVPSPPRVAKPPPPPAAAAGEESHSPPALAVAPPAPPTQAMPSGPMPASAAYNPYFHDRAVRRVLNPAFRRVAPLTFVVPVHVELDPDVISWSDLSWDVRLALTRAGWRAHISFASAPPRRTTPAGDPEPYAVYHRIGWPQMEAKGALSTASRTRQPYGAGAGTGAGAGAGATASVPGDRGPLTPFQSAALNGYRTARVPRAPYVPADQLHAHALPPHLRR